MVSRQDKWSFGKCFDFAEKCSASIKFGPGLNGNSANVREEKFQFCLLGDAGPAILWDERTSGVPTAKSPRLNVTNNPSPFLQLLSPFDQVLLISSPPCCPCCPQCRRARTTLLHVFYCSLLLTRCYLSFCFEPGQITTGEKE